MMHVYVWVYSFSTGMLYFVVKSKKDQTEVLVFKVYFSFSVRFHEFYWNLSDGIRNLKKPVHIHLLIDKIYINAGLCSACFAHLWPSVLPCILFSVTKTFLYPVYSELFMLGRKCCWGLSCRYGMGRTAECVTSTSILW